MVMSRNKNVPPPTEPLIRFITLNEDGQYNDHLVSIDHFFKERKRYGGSRMIDFKYSVSKYWRKYMDGYATRDQVVFIDLPYLDVFDLFCDKNEFRDYQENCDEYHIWVRLDDFPNLQGIYIPEGYTCIIAEFNPRLESIELPESTKSLFLRGTPIKELTLPYEMRYVECNNDVYIKNFNENVNNKWDFGIHMVDLRSS